MIGRGSRLLSILCLITLLSCETGNKGSGDLAAPGNVTASLPDTGGVLINWEHDGAEQFDVYRYTTDENSEMVGTSTSGNAFLDSTCPSDTPVRYGIQAVNNSKTSSMSELSNEVTMIITTIPAPASVTATEGSGEITIEWVYGNDPDSFVVYRTADGNEPQQIGTPSGENRSFADLTFPGGVELTYAVAAVIDGTESPRSDWTTGLTVAATGLSALTAEMSDTAVTLNWNYDRTADSFQIYRQVGTDAAEMIHTVDGETGTWQDTSFPKTELVRYALRVETGGSFSPLSEYTAPLIHHLSGLEASAFQYDDGIRLQWSAVSGLGGNYVLYRYLTVNDSNPVRLTQTDSLSYDDLFASANGPASGEPYFYRLGWNNGTTDTGLNGSAVLGVASANVDFYEENNSFSDVENSSGSSTFNASQPPVAYSFGDGAGGIHADNDWYVYRADLSASTLTVTVTLPNDSGFETGDLFFQYYYSGAWVGSPEEITVPDGTPGYVADTFSFPPLGYTLPAEEVPVYYRISVQTGSTMNVWGTYTVETSDEL